MVKYSTSAAASGATVYHREFRWAALRLLNSAALNRYASASAKAFFNAAIAA